MLVVSTPRAALGAAHVQEVLVRRSVAAVVLLLAALTACSGGGGKAKPSADASKPAGGLPSVSGSYGAKPALTFPSGAAPGSVQVRVLRQGSGPVVAKGELLVADYLGQVWQGKVFDNSYDRGQVAAFPIGVGRVIPGWDQTLVGVKAGSRVLLSVPPSAGYGTTGNSAAGIKGTDTLVFVVDLVSSYSGKVAGDPKAVPQRVTVPGVTVSGALGASPGLGVVPAKFAVKKPAIQVLARGTGAPVAGGLLVVQYLAVDASNKPVGSSWTAGTPIGVPVNPSGSSGLFDLTRGLPLGSRVLIEAPASPGSGSEAASPPIALVADLVAQPKTAKETG
jgi:peptidylprolyl isomerase